jgi:hypothetical protein
MAIYTLPNGSTWDSTIDIINQNTGSQHFWGDILETVTPVLVTENTCNPTRSRTIKSTWSDTSYSGSNYIITKTNNYMHGAMSDQCFAKSGVSYQYQIESK